MGKMLSVVTSILPVLVVIFKNYLGLSIKLDPYSLFKVHAIAAKLPFSHFCNVKTLVKVKNFLGKRG
jgi:hypothetical protein